MVPCENDPPKAIIPPMTQEEFVDRTLEAWTYSDGDSRVSAAFRGGEREWEILWNDESCKVRGAITCRVSEEYQLKLVGDPIAPIRKLLAIYGADRVPLALVERGEQDKDVIQSFAKFGNTAVRHQLMDVVWDKTDLLIKCVSYLPASSIEKLMSHPDTDVQIHATLHGTREQCRHVLSLPENLQNLSTKFLRSCLIDRINELDKVANIITVSHAKSHKNREAELFFQLTYFVNT